MAETANYPSLSVLFFYINKTVAWPAVLHLVASSMATETVYVIKFSPVESEQTWCANSRLQPASSTLFPTETRSWQQLRFNHVHEDNASLGHGWRNKMEGALNDSLEQNCKPETQKKKTFYFVWTTAFWGLFVAAASTSLIIYWTWEHLPSVLLSLEKKCQRG